MTRAYWSQVKAGGLAVPDDRPLADLTTELTTMLGSPDPHMRDGLAYPTLATWIDRGVYDDLITGLGDGMAAGLTVGLGEQGTDSVFRRAFSVLVLAECIDRDNQEGLLPAGKLLEWGDRIASWYLRERDLRGFVAGKGWAHTVAHGADAIGVLGAVAPSGPQRADGAPRRHRRPPAGARRRAVRARRARPDGAGDDDRCCAATSCRSPWSSRGSPGSRPAPSTRPTARPTRSSRRPTPRRSCGRCYLQLAIAPSPPDIRPDLLLVLVVGAAHDQPVVPVLTYSSVTCGHDR